MGISFGVALFLASVVGTIATGAGEEAAECLRVSQQLNESTDHYKNVVKSLQKYDQNIAQNHDEVVNYLVSMTNELRKLKDNYANTYASMKKKFSDIQFITLIFFSFIIGLFVLKWINSSKITK